MSLFQEFKDFITKGNILDLAIGLVMGSAFTAIVTSLVNDIITPFIGIFTGSLDFSQYVVKFLGAQLKIGSFIQAIFSFLIISLVLFFIIKALNKARQLAQRKEAVDEAVQAPSEEVQLLTEIRDLLQDKK